MFPCEKNTLSLFLEMILFSLPLIRRFPAGNALESIRSNSSAWWNEKDYETRTAVASAAAQERRLTKAPKNNVEANPNRTAIMLPSRWSRMCNTIPDFPFASFEGDDDSPGKGSAVLSGTINVNHWWFQDIVDSMVLYYVIWLTLFIYVVKSCHIRELYS